MNLFSLKNIKVKLNVRECRFNRDFPEKYKKTIPLIKSIDELLVDVKADTKDRVGEHASNMDDLMERGSDKVKYLFTSLQSEEKIYGLNRPANYTKCWNVVQGLLQNTVDLDEQIEILQTDRKAVFISMKSIYLKHTEELECKYEIINPI